VTFVGNQSGPLPIPDQEIEDIRTVLAARVAYSHCPSLNKGDRVRVVRGALVGVEGTLVADNSTSHLLVSIEMIRQSLSVNVLRDDVELVSINSVRTTHFVQDRSQQVPLPFRPPLFACSDTQPSNSI
jgi:transcription antitermination factor NusG